MKAFVLAAGLGTRLKPFTLYHPKALVPVAGIPMLNRVINRLKEEGATDFVINIHHFGEQIIEYISSQDFGVNIFISDERDLLLDTGGGLLKASDMLFKDSEDVIVHNVDILSDAPISGLFYQHKNSEADVTLLISDRESSRKLVFDEKMDLKGWHNLSTGEYRPEGFHPDNGMKEYAFSGIYAVNKRLTKLMKSQNMRGKFPIMDYLLKNLPLLKVRGMICENLRLLDIGKPATLQQAQEIFSHPD